METALPSFSKSDNRFTNSRRRNPDSNSTLFFDSFLPPMSGYFPDNQNIVDMDLPFTRQPGTYPMLMHNGRIWEPPYAHLLRQLGLFDSIDVPKHRIKRHESFFPVVVHSARTPAQSNMKREKRDAWLPEEESDVDTTDRDIRNLIGPVSEAFGETTRWAVGSLFGQLRNAMDYVESSIQNADERQDKNDKRQTPEGIDTSLFFKALRSDLISNFDKTFPESDDDVYNDKVNSSYYQFSSRTMPDGSVETRKVVRDTDGTKKTTVTRHYPDSSKEDETTTITTDNTLPGVGSYDKDE